MTIEALIHELTAHANHGRMYVRERNRRGRYPTCYPGIGDGPQAHTCPRCGGPFPNDDACPAVEAFDLWGPRSPSRIAKRLRMRRMRRARINRRGY